MKGLGLLRNLTPVFTAAPLPRLPLPRALAKNQVPEDLQVSPPVPMPSAPGFQVGSSGCFCLSLLSGWGLWLGALVFSSGKLLWYFAFLVPWGGLGVCVGHSQKKDPGLERRLSS